MSDRVTRPHLPDTSRFGPLVDRARERLYTCLRVALVAA